MTPDTTCDPYSTVLRAGELRSQAGRLVGEAEVLEGMARMQLQRMNIPTNVITQTPNSVLYVAYGGYADGKTERAPFESITQLKLTYTPEGSDMVAVMDYMPAMIVRLGSYVVGAMVVPKIGGMAKFYDGLRDETPREAGDYPPLPLAITKMLVLSCGFSADMIQDVVASAQHVARQLDSAPDHPIFLQLGSPQ